MKKQAKSILRAFVFAAAVAAAAATDVSAQWSTTEFTLILRDGKKQEVSASPIFRIDEKEMMFGGLKFDRAEASVLCYRTCPDPLPTIKSNDDVIVWADGTQTSGRIETIYFDSDRDNDCRVVLNGKTLLIYEFKFIKFAKPESSAVTSGQRPSKKKKKRGKP